MKMDVLINEKKKIVSGSGRKSNHIAFSNEANINCVTVTATSWFLDWALFYSY